MSNNYVWPIQKIHFSFAFENCFPTLFLVRRYGSHGLCYAVFEVETKHDQGSREGVLDCEALHIWSHDWPTFSHMTNRYLVTWLTMTFVSFKVLIRFHIQRNVIVIPKSSNPDRIKQNFQVPKSVVSSSTVWRMCVLLSSLSVCQCLNLFCFYFYIFLFPGVWLWTKRGRHEDHPKLQQELERIWHGVVRERER